MDVDRTPLDQPAALHELQQVPDPSTIPTSLPLSNGMRGLPIFATLVTFVLLV
jgi:hypothetical protein